MYLMQWDDPLLSCSFTTQNWLLLKNQMWWGKSVTLSESTVLNWLKSHYLVPAFFKKVQFVDQCYYRIIICWLEILAGNFLGDDDEVFAGDFGEHFLDDLEDPGTWLWYWGKIRRTLHFTPKMMYDKAYNHISYSIPGSMSQK